MRLTASVASSSENIHIAHASKGISQARSRSPAGTRATLRVSFLTILLRS